MATKSVFVVIIVMGPDEDNSKSRAPLAYFNSEVMASSIVDLLVRIGYPRSYYEPIMVHADIEEWLDSAETPLATRIRTAFEETEIAEYVRLSEKYGGRAIPLLE